MNKEIYRFTWLRTFHKPIVVRIEKEVDNYYLTYKVCDEKGGYDPGKLIINNTTSIDKESWNKLQLIIENSDFWQTKDYTSKNTGVDGSEWILEGVTPSKYKVVSRWNPSSGYFSNACRLLLSLTGLDIKSLD